MSKFAGLPKYALQVKVKGGEEWKSILYFEEKMSVRDFEYRIFLHNETESSSVSRKIFDEVLDELKDVYEEMINYKNKCDKEIAEKEAELLRWKAIALDRKEPSRPIENRSE